MSNPTPTVATRPGHEPPSQKLERYDSLSSLQVNQPPPKTPTTDNPTPMSINSRDVVDGNDDNDEDEGIGRYMITRNGEMIFENDDSSAASTSTAARHRYVSQISQAQRTTELRREKKWLDMLVRWEQWKLKKDHVKLRTRKSGVPESLRGCFWPIFSDAVQLKVARYKQLGLSMEEAQPTQAQLLAKMTTSPSIGPAIDDMRESFLSRNSFSLAERATFIGSSASAGPAAGPTHHNSKPQATPSPTPTNCTKSLTNPGQTAAETQLPGNNPALPLLPNSLSQTLPNSNPPPTQQRQQQKQQQQGQGGANSSTSAPPRPPSGTSTQSSTSGKAGATPPPPPARSLPTEGSNPPTLRPSSQHQRLTAVTEGIGLDLDLNTNNQSISGTATHSTSGSNINPSPKQPTSHLDPTPTMALPPPPPPRNLATGSVSISVTNQDEQFQRTNSNHLNLMDSSSTDNLQPLQHSASSGLIIDSSRLDLYKREHGSKFRDRNSIDTGRTHGLHLPPTLDLPASPVSASMRLDGNSNSVYDGFDGIPENVEHQHGMSQSNGDRALSNHNHLSRPHQSHTNANNHYYDNNLNGLPRPSRSGPQHQLVFGALPQLPTLGSPINSATESPTTAFTTPTECDGDGDKKNVIDPVYEHDEHDHQQQQQQQSLPLVHPTAPATQTSDDDYVMVHPQTLHDGQRVKGFKIIDQQGFQVIHPANSIEGSGSSYADFDAVLTRPRHQGDTPPPETSDDDNNAQNKQPQQKQPLAAKQHLPPPKKPNPPKLQPLLTSPSDLNQGHVVAVAPTAGIPSPISNTNNLTPSNGSQSLTNHRPVSITTPSKQDRRRDNNNSRQNNNNEQKGGQAPNLEDVASAGNSTSMDTVSIQSPSELGSLVFFSYTLHKDEEPPETYSLYRKLASTESTFDSLICKDVKRTFASHVLFSENNGRSRVPVNRARQYLADICRAYVHYDADLGYCQGISFLVATLLMYMEAEDAFWVLVSLLQNPRYNLRGLFTTGFPLLQEYMFVTEELMRKVDSRLYKHLKKVGFNYSVCMPQWLMGLYVYALPLSIGLRIWDCLLYEGPKILIRTALFLVSHFRKRILDEAELDGVFNVILGDLPQATELYADPDKFMSGVYKISITTEDIDKLSKVWRATQK